MLNVAWCYYKADSSELGRLLLISMTATALIEAQVAYAGAMVTSEATWALSLPGCVPIHHISVEEDTSKQVITEV